MSDRFGSEDMSVDDAVKGFSTNEWGIDKQNTYHKQISKDEVELAKSLWNPESVSSRFNEQVMTTGPLIFDGGHTVKWDNEFRFDLKRGLEIYDDFVSLKNQRETVNEDTIIQDVNIIKLADFIIEDSIKEEVSDIVIVQYEDFGLVRFAYGKIWKNQRLLYKSSVDPLITVLKHKAGLKFKFENAKIPQTNGKIVVGKTNFRVSTGQSQFGMFMNLRRQGSDFRTLDELDFPDLIKSEVRKAVSAKDGLIVMGGPVGSGKSTLQNASISERLQQTSGSINVISLEKPIEVTIPGVIQEQIDEESGLTWSKAIQASLRQMPTILRVGEVNEKQAADALVRAANSGIIAMTTMHIKSSLEIFETLNDYSISENDIKNSLRLVVYMNRVPRLCHHCRKEHSILEVPEDSNWINKNLNDEEQAIVPVIYSRNPEGCEYCRKGQSDPNLFGTLGSVGIYELLKVNQPLLRIWRKYSMYDSYVLKDKILHPEQVVFDEAIDGFSNEETEKEKADRILKLTSGLMYIPLERDIIAKLSSGDIDVETAKYLMNE